MPSPNPYLTFNGNCAQAFQFYARVLGGQVEAVHTFGSSPMAEQIPRADHDKVMHALLKLDGQALMGSDCMPGQPYEGMKGFSLSLNVATVDEATTVFKALSEGGQITMPLAPTFWAQAFGTFVDRFGTPWMVNCELARA